MPQDFDAVQCASCSSFQVQQRGATKKRWTCVVCGEKQSYVRLYASGSAKDLRPIVQRLNMARGAAAEEVSSMSTVWQQPCRTPNGTSVDLYALSPGCTLTAISRWRMSRGTSAAWASRCTRRCPGRRAAVVP